MRDQKQSKTLCQALFEAWLPGQRVRGTVIQNGESQNEGVYSVSHKGCR